MTKSMTEQSNLGLAEQVLYELSERYPGQHIAILIFKEKIFFSTIAMGWSGPSSATVKLIQGIFDDQRDLSFFILRQRIYTTEDIGPMIKGMVKLAAKRISQVVPKNNFIKHSLQVLRIAGEEPLVPVKSLLLEVPFAFPERISSPEEGIRIVTQWAQSVPRGAVLHDHNRSIGAMLVSAEGYVLAHSTNQASLNKTLHAEVRTVQKYWSSTQGLIPRGAQIFVSLKPCLMCAGMIAESSADLETLKVYYAENDKGPLAQRTALEKNLIFLPSL